MLAARGLRQLATARAALVSPVAVASNLRGPFKRAPMSSPSIPFSSTSHYRGSNSNGGGGGGGGGNASRPPATPPPPPSPSSSKSKTLKSTKPSSKVNARTSRLLRSQLVTPGGQPGPATRGVSRREEKAVEAEAEEASSSETVPEEAATHPATRSSSPSSASASAAAAAAASAAREIRAATAWATDSSISTGDDDSTHLPRLQEAIAYATASSYDFQALIDSGRLPPDWRFLEDGQVIYLPSWPVHRREGIDSASLPSYSHPHVSSGEVFILRTGAYVAWGINQEQARRFRSIVLSPRSAASSRQPAVERGTYEEVGEEEMDFVSNNAEHTRIVGDVLVIGQPPNDPPAADDPWSPLLARLSFSAGLALSARLSSQEASLSHYLASVQSIPRLLEEKGRVPIGRREVVRKMGRLLKLRQMVNLEEGSKVEELELFWENAIMEKHYDSICLTLDIEPRFRSLNEQLDHAENLMGVLRALLTEGSSHRMEVIIIALIAIEVTLALVSHGYLGGGGSEGSDGQGDHTVARH